MVQIRIIRRRTIYIAVSIALAVLGLLIAWAFVSRPGVSAYFPLSTGSWWIYRSTDSEQASYRQDVLYRRGDLAQIRVDNGAATQMKVYAVDAAAVTLRHTADVRSDKTESYLDSHPNANGVLLKTPLKVGAKWVTDGWLHEVVSVSERVATPAGVFDDCVKIKAISPDGTTTVHRYHKKGVGIVRTEHITDSRTIVTELAEYRVR